MVNGDVTLMRSVLWFLLVLLLPVAGSHGARADAWQIDVQGPIGPATADHLLRALDRAEQANAELVILRIDTPGGLDASMRDMIKGVLASKVPVVGWVGPSGARAASAGTYLLYATHVAAMAPGTNLGAATPVQVGSPGLPSMPRGRDDSGEPGEEGAAADPATAMEKKIINDAVAYIQGLAQLRDRNIEWAERAVRDGASLSAEDAQAQGVVDLLAVSVPDLLKAIDGRSVRVGESDAVLDTAGLAVHHQAVDWRSEFLAVITNPNVAYILMLIGIYGLIIEFYNPGIGLPGVLGAISLLLALYAFQALPVSYAGIGLIILGIGLMSAEAFAPSFGVLGLGGIAAFVVGSIMLMDTNLPAYQVALPLILGFAVFSVALLVFALGMVLRARRQELVSGIARLAGSTATVESLEGGAARVRLDGELWLAHCDEPLALEDEVRVDAVDGLTLSVSKEHKE